MGRVHHLRPAVHEDPPPVLQSERFGVVHTLRCDLCGGVLADHGPSYHLLSPRLRAGVVTVCHTCRKAALGEGYRPAV
jgi:hypothetical protein